MDEFEERRRERLADAAIEEAEEREKKEAERIRQHKEHLETMKSLEELKRAALSKHITPDIDYGQRRKERMAQERDREKKEKVFLIKGDEESSSSSYIPEGDIDTKADEVYFKKGGKKTKRRKTKRRKTKTKRKRKSKSKNKKTVNRRRPSIRKK